MNPLNLQLLAIFLGVTSALEAAPSSGKVLDLGSLERVPEGLAAADWRSIREAYESGRHAFQPSDAGWQARNPGQRWAMEFDRHGFTTQPDEGGWSWGLELQSYGFGQSQSAFSDKPVVNVSGSGLSYQRDAVVEEWFINDQRGLKHGFTVARRPASAGAVSTSLLAFTLTTHGSLNPVINLDGQGVVFKNDAQVDIVTYTGLKVWDDDGKLLSSHFAAAGERSFRLVIDERGARYPITIDPIAQRAYLKATAVDVAPPPDRFGYSVAVSQNMVVVGAPSEDSSSLGVNGTPIVTDNHDYDSGAAYIFTRSGTRWTQEAYLKPMAIGDSQEGDRFGHSVAVSNGTVVVGAPHEDSSTTGVNTVPGDSASTGQDSGAVYVYVYDSGEAAWFQEAYLKPESVGLSQEDDGFGWSVAIAGETLAVGAPFEASSTTGVNSIPNEDASASGAAYVFVRHEGNWNQEAYVKPESVGTTQVGDSFGWSVGLLFNGLVVGAPDEDSISTGINSAPEDTGGPMVNSGAGYIFSRSGTTWSQQAFLKPDVIGVSQAGDRFGFSVAAAWSFTNDYIIVGAPLEDSNSTGVDSAPDEESEDAGAAYVFVRSGETWTQQAYLKPQSFGDSQDGDRFGHSVGISPYRAAVGAPFEDSNATGIDSLPEESANDAGAVYVFARSSGTWSHDAFLKPEAVGMTQAGDHFGFSVAMSDTILSIGAPLEDSDTVGIHSEGNENAANAGASYIMTLEDHDWHQQAYVKAAGFGMPQELDYFGWSVSVSGDTVIVGAYQEDSGSLGINSVPNDNATEAGAAYIFVKTDGLWTQQAYLKPVAVGTSQAFDEFGYSVAISGDTAVVGAHYESSSSTGINSTPNENAAGAGAAYVFVRDDGLWTQEAYLKPDSVGETQEYDQFGYSVAISGNTVVVGALREDSAVTGINQAPDENATNAGAAYVFVCSDGLWTQEAYLKPSEVGSSQLGDEFGTSVTVSGDTVVVGAPWESSSTTGANSTPDEDSSFAGAIYVFVRSKGIWNQQAYLKPDDGGIKQVGDRFGWSVAVADDILIAGAPGEDSSSKGINSAPDELASDAGAAYVFVQSEGHWEQQAYLKPGTLGETQGQDRFGWSVAASGDTVVVGARAKNDGATGVNPPPPPHDISEDLTISAGAAYVFVRSEGRWSQRAYMKPEAIGASQDYDLFGTSVGVSDDTVVVGAHGESSSTSGVNSVPDEHVFSAGAAYIYDGFGSVLAPIQAWRQTHFSEIENAGTAANHMDFDGDGWANIVEYGVATNPEKQGESSIALGLSSDGQFLEARFTRDPSRNDVTINVQTAESPAGPWTTVATSVDGTSMIGPGLLSEADLTNGLIQVDVRDTIPISAADTLRRFLRVVVE